MNRKYFVAERNGRYVVTRFWAGAASWQLRYSRAKAFDDFDSAAYVAEAINASNHPTPVVVVEVEDGKPD